MDQESNLPEWKITDKLPEAFVEWLIKTLIEKSMDEKIGFMALADELGVDPALLSR